MDPTEEWEEASASGSTKADCGSILCRPESVGPRGRIHGPGDASMAQGTSPGTRDTTSARWPQAEEEAGPPTGRRDPTAAARLPGPLGFTPAGEERRGQKLGPFRPVSERRIRFED